MAVWEMKEKPPLIEQILNVEMSRKAARINPSFMYFKSSNAIEKWLI